MAQNESPKKYKVTFVETGTKDTFTEKVKAYSEREALNQVISDRWGDNAFLHLNRGLTGEGSRLFGQVFVAVKGGSVAERATARTGNCYFDVDEL